MAQQPQGGLDYRQHYGQHNPQPAPYGHHGQPAYPGHNQGWGFFRNPLSGGQWLMIIGGAVMVGGLAYYGWVRYKQSKGNNQQPQPAQNPAHSVRHLRPVHNAGAQAYNRAA